MIIIFVAKLSETCPICGETLEVRTKIVLIDEALVLYLPGPGVLDVRAQYLRERPLQERIDGSYCDRCKKFSVSEEVLKRIRRRHR